MYVKSLQHENIHYIEQPTSLQEVIILGIKYYFMLPDEFNWARNFTVQGMLAQHKTLLQPMNFTFGSETVFQVFFQLVRETGPNAGIQIDFPPGFRIYPVCYSWALPDGYGSTWMGALPGAVFERVYGIGVIKSCTGSFRVPPIHQPIPLKNFNRAVLELEENLRPGYVYGFELVAQLPTEAEFERYINFDFDNNWEFKVASLSSKKEIMDETYLTVANNAPVAQIIAIQQISPPVANGSSTGSFLMHRAELAPQITPKYVFADRRPYAQTGTVTSITTQLVSVWGSHVWE